MAQQTELNREGLFSSALPDGVEPAVRSIQRLAELGQQQRGNSAPRAELMPLAGASYRALLEQVATFTGDATPSDLGSLDDIRARFAESVLMWMQFCTTSSLPLIDSIDTSVLRAFPLDLPLDPAAFTHLKHALCESQGLDARALYEAEHRVQHLTSALPLKLALTQALKDSLAANGARDFGALMQRFYGELPLRAGDVDFVLTSTGIFFVLPIAGNELARPDYATRSPAERAGVEAFLTRLARGNLTETWRFPAFGLFERALLDRGLVEELSERTGVRADVVERTLVTMVSIIPKSEIDQYLVHDAWGHTWQEALSEFEWEYELLRGAAEPLAPEHGPGFGGALVQPFASAFRAVNGVCQLDEERFLATAEADLRGRIQVGLSAVLSEVLADFVEAKFSRLNPDHPLPTSSLLEANALKFDLTVQDVLRQARRWSAPYLDFCAGSAQQRLFFDGLVRLGLPEAGLASALERARAAIGGRFGCALRPVIAAAPDDAQGATIATRALLKCAQLSGALEHVLSETTAHRASPAWTRPTYCPDLWAVAVSQLYEGDRQTRFWQLDWLIRNSLLGACEALGRAT